MSDRGRRGRTQKRRTLRTDATRTNTHRLYGSCIRKYIHLQTIQKIFPKPENRGEGNEDSMRGVEKKSIATSDTRFVENIQKNGIRVEINDTYRMYKQYVLFSDAKTPSRRDFSFFFYTGRIRRFAAIVFTDTTTWLIVWFLRSRDTRRRASERRPAKRCARFTTRSLFFYFCVSSSRRGARVARVDRAFRTRRGNTGKSARGARPRETRGHRFSRETGTGWTTRRGGRRDGVRGRSRGEIFSRTFRRRRRSRRRRRRRRREPGRRTHPVSVDVSRSTVRLGGRRGR